MSQIKIYYMKNLTKQVTEIQVQYLPRKSEGRLIQSSEDAFREFLPFYPKETISLQERFLVMYLNRCNKVLGIYTASTGGLTGTVVDVRIILSVALKIAATGMILSHNHPSGNVKASQADIEMTRKMAAACTLMDIKLLDHLIITADHDYYSMLEESHL